MIDCPELKRIIDKLNNHRFKVYEGYKEFTLMCHVREINSPRLIYHTPYGRRVIRNVELENNQLRFKSDFEKTATIGRRKCDRGNCKHYTCVHFHLNVRVVDLIDYINNIYEELESRYIPIITGQIFSVHCPEKKRDEYYRFIMNMDNHTELSRQQDYRHQQDYNPPQVKRCDNIPVKNNHTKKHQLKPIKDIYNSLQDIKDETNNISTKSQRRSIKDDLNTIKQSLELLEESINDN